MTCRRIEDSDLLGEPGEALDSHVEQCPDCSERAHGYRRIAGWLADGKTSHRPPADWRSRTLAHVLAANTRLQSVPTAARESRPAGDLEPAARPAVTGEPVRDVAGAASSRTAVTIDLGARSTRPPEPTRPGSASTHAQALSSRRRLRRSRAVFLIASAAIVIAVVSVAMRGGDSQHARRAIKTDGTLVGKYEVTRIPLEDAEGVAVSHAHESLDSYDVGSRGAPTESPSRPSTAPAGGEPPPVGKRPASPRRQRDVPQTPESVVRPTTRGGGPVVDWPVDTAPGPDAPGSLDFATGSGVKPGGADTRSRSRSDGDGQVEGDLRIVFESPADSLGRLTSEEIKRVVEARTGVFRACYPRELQHTPEIHGKLIVSFKIGPAGQVLSVDSVPSSSSRNEAVAQCVMLHIKHLRFPSKDGIADVTYSFELTDRH
jgi:hypothetical protein